MAQVSPKLVRERNSNLVQVVQRDSDIRASSGANSTISKRSVDNVAIVQTEGTNGSAVSKDLQFDLENLPAGRTPDSVSFGIRTVQPRNANRDTGNFGNDPSAGLG